MEPLISVIVPVYRVEAYLRQCVDSICNQTYQNLEIILVDDGSPDRCGEICDFYAAQDARISVIHKKNGGLSDARNAGMAMSRGDYLIFVDSDDLLPPDAVRTLINFALSEDAALVIGDHIRFTEKIPEKNIVHQETAIRTFTGVEAMKDMLENGCASWARLYRREIHQYIQFPVGEINEDEAIVLRILENCKKVVKINSVVYFYRCRPESITTSFFSIKKMDWAKHCADNLEYVRKYHPELVVDAAARYRSSLLYSLSEIALSNEDYTKEVHELKKALREQKRLFFTAPFSYPQEQIRMWLLLHLPFKVYQIIMRLRRK